MDGVTGELSAKTNTNLAMIVHSGRRLSNLINDILDFSKLRYKNIELQIHPVSIREIFELVLILIQPLASHKPLQLDNQIGQGLPLIDADENRLQQILYNLVGNAIKFTDSGKIEVYARLINSEITVNNNRNEADNKSYIAITISDTGIGISPDKFDSIFESFEQGDGSNARKYGGTGLGLAITKQLIELHGGKISVESIIGFGSKFTFTLPVSQGTEILKVNNQQIYYPINKLNQYSLSIANEVNNTSSNLANSKMEVDPLNILIVDDEPVNLQVLVNYLEPQGYSITQVSSGIEALEMIEHGFKPDLIKEIPILITQGYSRDSEALLRTRVRLPLGEAQITDQT